MYEPPMFDVNVEINAIKAEVERLRTAVIFVVERFEKDEAQGYHTKDREFAISILRKALGGDHEQKADDNG